VATTYGPFWQPPESGKKSHQRRALITRPKSLAISRAYGDTMLDKLLAKLPIRKPAKPALHTEREIELIAELEDQAKDLFEARREIELLHKQLDAKLITPIADLGGCVGHAIVGEKGE
jgi:hypothetical protein